MKTHGFRYSFLLALGMAAVLLAGCTSFAEEPSDAAADPWNKFEAKLEYLRRQMQIPGMSAAVVKDRELAWAKGFGYADLENRVAAAPQTPYHLGFLTEPVAATVVMQLVKEGAIGLDDPISKHGIDVGNQGTIRVRHLLSHSSSRVPGATYLHDPGLYVVLGYIAQQASGKTFGTLMQERILGSLGMEDTWMNYPRCAVALGLTPYPTNWESGQTPAAKPYQWGLSDEMVAGFYNYRDFSPAAGLVSSVTDLAKFDIALDQNALLNEEAKAQMFTPAVSIYPDRPDLAHGLGWFSQEFMGTRLVWNIGGISPSISGIYLKAPEQNLTFLILANTDFLNAPLPEGDITYSTAALDFYEAFVYPRQSGKTVPEVDWEAGKETLADQLKQESDPDVRGILERELWAYSQMFAATGKRDLAYQLLNVYQQVFPDYPSTALDLHTYRRNAAFAPTPAADPVHLSDAELERLVGTYILSDSQAAAGVNLPLEAKLQAVRGELAISAEGGCVDLVALSSTRFIAEDNQFTLTVEMDGGVVESVKVKGNGFEAVYVPKP